jgi:hypothetical protein
MSTDLHSPVLAAIQAGPEINGCGECGQHGNAEAALRAVVYLHPTEQHYTIGQDSRRTASGLYCRRCRTSAPCEEIRTIAEALGVQ